MGEVKDVKKFATEGDRELNILFGSQSGNSEGLAEEWEKEAARYGLNGKVHDMDGFDIKSMANMARVMIVCSTWGEGDMPDNAEELYEEAKEVGKILTKTHFSICALGDTGYDLFCQSGKDWDKTLEDMGGSRIHDRVDCDVDYEVPADEWMKEAMPKLACVDEDGTFMPDLVDNMVAYASGVEIEGPSAEPEMDQAIAGGTTGYQNMTTASLFFHKPNKWLKRVKGVLDEEELPTTGIEKAKDMFKELRKITLKSLPQGKDYIALVDNEKCIGCTQCVYYCNFASIDMISWDLNARTSQFESKKALIVDDTCVGCTLCAFACPVEAITMESKI